MLKISAREISSSTRVDVLYKVEPVKEPGLRLSFFSSEFTK